MIVKVSEKENGQVIETQVSLLCKPIYPGMITKLNQSYSWDISKQNQIFPTELYAKIVRTDYGFSKFTRFFPIEPKVEPFQLKTALTKILPTQRFFQLHFPTTSKPPRLDQIRSS